MKVYLMDGYVVPNGEMKTIKKEHKIDCRDNKIKVSPNVF